MTENETYTIQALAAMAILFVTQALRDVDVLLGTGKVSKNWIYSNLADYAQRLIDVKKRFPTTANYIDDQCDLHFGLTPEKLYKNTRGW